MLNIYNLSIAFQGDYLFQAVSFKLIGGDRVGLIGKNGAGKSTLLKIIANEIEYDSGQIATEKKLKIGFLKQDIDFKHGRTLLEESYEAFSELKKIENQIDSINQELASRKDYESETYHQLMIDLNEVQHQYEILGGYRYKGQTERILQGLGFKRNDFNKLTDTFSGGWRMRIELAKLLLENNDILLLDEPTNHLDIESIIWLESFLKNYLGALVIVSHDKMFLDTITNRTIELSMGKLYDYSKPYSEYLEFRKLIRAQQLAAQKNQNKQIEQTQKLIDKFRAKASKASMAQSLIKKLDKIERIDVDDEDNSLMHLSFPVSVTPGKIIAELKDVSKHYGKLHVLNNIDLQISRDSKIAFVGQNGQGKSTLAKILVGDTNCTGYFKLGHNVQIGYFAQNQAQYLDGKKTVLDTMIDAANKSNRAKVRDILGAFLFRGDDVDKYVSVLSGGERNRLALAKLLLQPLNVLIMDEPTNHLDIKSKNVLKDALIKFQGTLILVSHDRDFLQGLANIIYEFKDNKIKEYLGDIEFFLEQRNLENLREAEKSDMQIREKSIKPKNQSYNDQKQLKALKNKLNKVESQISQLEKEIKNIDIELEINYIETVSDPKFFDKYKDKKNQLDHLINQWEVLQTQMETLEV